jgi:nucleoside-diphosphate-sugar epimerase
VKIVITGGCGFLGLRLARRLLERGELTRTGGGLAPIDEIVLADALTPKTRPGGLDERARVARGDVADPAFIESLLAGGDVSIFHLASVVSAQAETDPELAFRVNVEGARSVLNAARDHGGLVRVVTTSSYAAFGGDLPPVCDDGTKLTPESTYGMTKVVLELLINDYTRRGAIDGRVARLPIVIVRPGAANLAASSMASAIFREPLAGRDYAIPVAAETRLAVTGVRTAVEGLIALHEADSAAIGLDRAVSFPSAASTIGEMVDVLQRVAGDRPLGTLTWQPDPRVEAIVSTWPSLVDATAALTLGVPPTDSFERIICDAMADVPSPG